MTGSPAAEGRYALVVATARYTAPGLAQLRAPAADAERLGAVLGDPERGDFDDGPPARVRALPVLS